MKASLDLIPELDEYIQEHNHGNREVCLRRALNVADCAMAAEVFMVGFLGSKDLSYLNIFSREMLSDLYNGKGALNRDSRVFVDMVELTSAELWADVAAGGLLLIASLKNSPVGAALRSLPGMDSHSPDNVRMVNELSVIVFGPEGAEESDLIYKTEHAYAGALASLHGFNEANTIYNGLVTSLVPRTGVYSTMESVVNRLADSHGFARVHGSSAWRKNDERVFMRSGYELGEEFSIGPTKTYIHEFVHDAPDEVTETSLIRLPQ